jgi:hypothetical protein
LVAPGGVVDMCKRNILFALLGGILGLCTAVIFLLIYYFQKFELVTGPGIMYDPNLRFKSAFIGTALIVGATLVVVFRKRIFEELRNIYGYKEEDDEVEVETDN